VLQPNCSACAVDLAIAIERSRFLDENAKCARLFATTSCGRVVTAIEITDEDMQCPTLNP